MHKVFLDTSVFLASLRSPQGGSSELLRYAVVDSVEAFVSDDVMDEVARHIHEVDPGLRALLLRYLAVIPFQVISVTSEEVQWATAFTNVKDSFIVAAAQKAGVEYLVTLDKRHLLDKKGEIEPRFAFRSFDLSMCWGKLEGIRCAGDIVKNSPRCMNVGQVDLQTPNFLSPYFRHKVEQQAHVHYLRE